jgi:toxin ParE1/3/4
MPEKRRQVVWSLLAERDLRDVWRHYAEVASLEIADRMVREITETAARLADQARIWRARSDMAPGLRSVLVHPYLTFYRVNNGSVEIVRVLHGRRNLRQAIKNER